MPTVLDLYCIDPASPGGWPLIESILFAASVPVDFVEWIRETVVTKSKDVRELQHSLFEAQESRDNYQAEAEELQDMVDTYQRKFQEARQALASLFSQ